MTGYFRDESFRAVDCTGTDNQTQNNRKKICIKIQNQSINQEIFNVAKIAISHY